MYLGCETQRVGQHRPCDIDTLRDGSGIDRCRASLDVVHSFKENA